MELQQYQGLLLEQALHAMACDGHIDAREVDEFRRLTTTTPYFDELNVEHALRGALRRLQDGGTRAVDQALDGLRDVDLSERQRFRLLEVLLYMVHADGSVEAAECEYLQRTRDALGISVDAVARHFPTRFSLFMPGAGGSFQAGDSFRLPDSLPNVSDFIGG